MLPKADMQFLHEKEIQHTIQQEGAEIHVILHNWPLPPAYTPRTADLLIRVLPGYPLSPLDMFWTRPNVSLAGGGPPTTANVFEIYGGEQWQRWSRHGSWRAGIDNLRTFLASVSAELAKGI